MKRHRGWIYAALLCATVAGGCGDDETSQSGAGAAGGGTAMGGGGSGPVIGEDTMVTAFSAAHVFWSGWDEGQNAREVDVALSFPPLEQSYANVTMSFALSCPNNKCDPWDRYGWLAVVRNAGSDDEEVIEISRFITPFGVGAQWQADMTDLRPLLHGDVTLRVFIDTWVGPGSNFGDGWQVDASFALTGGIPERRAIANIPVWPTTRVTAGDPAKPVSAQLPSKQVELPAASSFALRSFVTGHGQGNADNCAEFCPLDHTFTVAGSEHTTLLWRDDCPETGAPNQQGTWQYPRAGWCPGAIAHPWTIEIADAASSIEIGYSVADYVNTCRPDAEPCTGCTLGNTCDYNDSTHTEPNYQLSALLIAYE